MNPIPVIPAQAAPDNDFERRKFLVVDDFQGMRTVLRDVLRNCGANHKLIETAANGKEAIRLLSSQSFDVVLCDFNLGEGQNGQQVLEEAKIKQFIGPACVWIMITAEKTTDAVTGAAEYQPDAYLLKPITEATLRQRLTKLWARKRTFADIDRTIRRGDYAGAIRLCDERIRTDKANGAELIRMKADLLIKTGNTQQARQVFESVLTQRDFPWAKAGLAKVMIQGGEMAAAKSLLEDTVRENPYYLEAHDLLAQTHQALGDLEAAARSLESAAKLSPNSVARQKVLGDISMKLGRVDVAERAFRKSVKLGEHSVFKAPDAYVGLAKVYSAKDKPEEALQAIDLLTKNFTDEGTRLQSMALEGIVQKKAGNTKKAEELAGKLERAIAEKGAAGAAQGSLDVARFLLAAGKQDSAVQLLQSQVKGNPDNASLLEEVKEVFKEASMGEEGAALVETLRQESIQLMNRGVMLARDGNFQEAITSMREARQVMPSNVRVLLNLAYVIITCLQKTEFSPVLVSEAKEALQAANSLSPGQARHVQLSAALDALVKSGATASQA